MKLEDQVCSCQLAKRLKELGVKQRSLFYHMTFINTSSVQYDKDNEKIGDDIIHENEWEDYKERSYVKKLKRYSAFTVAELGEMLPKKIDSEYKNYPYELNCKWELHYSDNKMWHITYVRYNDGDVMDFIIYDSNEANARAKMLIHLIENKYLELPK
jgi:hypothetical protein